MADTLIQQMVTQAEARTEAVEQAEVIAGDDPYVTVEWLSDQDVEVGPEQALVTRGSWLLMRRSEAIGRALAHPTAQVRLVPPDEVAKRDEGSS